jgi:hypothetical protein
MERLAQATELAIRNRVQRSRTDEVSAGFETFLSQRQQLAAKISTAYQRSYVRDAAKP